MAKNIKQSEEKTNVMRLLDGKKIQYKSYCYLDSGVVSGMEVAKVLHQNPAQAFKTLVTAGKSNTNYVFVIPVDRELDLKKAAAAVAEKKIEMVKSKDLLGLTGYIHGGCSPVGMKNAFRTVFDETMKQLDTVIFSGGKVGYQVELSPADLQKIIRFEYADLTEEM